jgi:thiamine biosynthesis protein ThiI
MRAIYLISGGMDSSIATYFGIRKGWKPIFLYFNNYPFTDIENKSKVIEIIRYIMNITNEYGEIIIAPHGRDLSIIIEKCRRNLSCLLCKRMMYRKAERIAKIYNCDFIVTGEIIGEQASQTIRNLLVNDKVIDMPIIRPLLGVNKVEVELLVKKLGISKMLTTSSCRAASIKARTRVREEELIEEEKKIPIEELIEESIRGIQIIK